jgi:hypothetical protein
LIAVRFCGASSLADGLRRNLRHIDSKRSSDWLGMPTVSSISVAYLGNIIGRANSLDVRDIQV